jgi:hypothetical protein
MPHSTKCERCGKTVCYDIPDEAVCKCGWSILEQDEEDFREACERRCEDLGEDFRALMRDFGGDLETIDSWLAFP